MSQPQNTVLNGPAGEVTMAFKDAQPAPDMIQSPTGGDLSLQNLYAQQANGNFPRPLNRVDSRSNFGTRPNFPNPQGVPNPAGVQFRPPPPQVRPPQPGVQQFVQRGPILQRPPGVPPPQQYIQPPQQRPPPINPNIQTGIRTGFPRQQGPGARPPAIYPQKSFPAPGSPRPLLPEDLIYRSQTLDSPDLANIKQENVPITTEEVKPAMAAMKSRSLSLSSSSEPPTSVLDDRRKSVSSIGSTEDRPSSGMDNRNGKIDELPERPESRASLMNKIEENDDDESPNNLSNKSPLSNENSIDNLSQKSNFSPSPQPSSILDTQIEQKPTTEEVPATLPESHPIKDEEDSIPTNREENKSPQPSNKNPEKPTLLELNTEEVKEEKSKSPVRDKKTPERKTPDTSRKTPDITKGRKTPDRKTPDRKTPDIHKTSRKTPDSALRKTPDGSHGKTVTKSHLRKTPDLKSTNGKAAKSPTKSEGDNDSGVDEFTQGNDQSSNGDHSSPRKTSSRTTTRSSVPSPTKNRSFSRGAKSPNPKSPDSAASSTTGAAEKKKVPMNKVQVGSAPSPNLKVVKSKIGSLQNANYKPGGGHVKIESKKLDFTNAAPRVTAKNQTYTPGGGDKKEEKSKIQQQKLHWEAKPKVGSLENATHKPKGGDKKIESVKLDFKDKAKPKVGSKDNMKHVPGGGDIKSEECHEEPSQNQEEIETKKIELNAASKVGSLNNVKHKPGGGDKKIFDDKEYLRQMSGLSGDNVSMSGSQTSLPSQPEAREPISDENLNKEH